MKTYRLHHCQARHRTFRTLAKCIWPRAAWISGNGRYALLARCRVLTVSLWTDPAEAEASKRVIDASACGGLCRHAAGHEIVQLADPAMAGQWEE